MIIYLYDSFPSGSRPHHLFFHPLSPLATMNSKSVSPNEVPVANLSLSDAPKCYRPKSSSLPVTFVRTIHLSDTQTSNEKTIPTELILQLFNDRTFLSISQLDGKLGTLLVCNVEESVIDNSTTFNVRTLLGSGVARSSTDREVALREVYVRAIAERILQHTRISAGVGPNTRLGEDGCPPIPPLVVGLALKTFGREAFGKVVEAAMTLYVKGVDSRERGVGMECPD